MRKAMSVNLERTTAVSSSVLNEHLPHLYSIANEILPQIYKTDGINGVVAARKHITDQMTALIEVWKPYDDLCPSAYPRVDDSLKLALNGILAIFDAFLSGVENAGR